MKTRDRILETTLRLFNEEGVAKVSTNRIADELGMSPGNLYYHFKSKALLVEWLLRRHESEMAPFTQSSGLLSALDDVWLSLHLSFEVIEKYRFIYTDIDFLVHEFPRCGERVRRMTIAAVKTTRQMCENLDQAGVLQAQSEELDSLAFQIVFTSTCWSTFSRLLMEDAAASAPGYAAYHVLTLMSPYLVDDQRHYMKYLRGKYLK